MIKKYLFPLLVLMVTFLAVATAKDAQASNTVVNLTPDPILFSAASGVHLFDVVNLDNIDRPPPGEDACDDPDPGKKLKCRYQKLADSICSTAELAESDATGFLAARKGNLQQYCDSTQTWINTPGRDEDFKKTFKKKDATCYIEEIIGDVDDKDKPIGDDDGICTKSEQNKNGCVEDDTDGIGDDDGVCEVTKTGPGKKFWEPCSQVCDMDDSGDPGDEELIDVELMDMIGSTIEGASEDLASYNETIQSMMQEWQTVSTALDTLNETYTYEPDKCLGLLLYSVDPYSEIVQTKVNSIHYSRLDRPLSYEDLDYHRVNTNYTAIMGETCDDAATVNWSVGLGGEAGGSTQVWCPLLHAVDEILADLSEGVELLDDAITGTRIDNTAQCLEYVSKNLKGIQGSLDYKVEWRRIHLQVIELKEKQEFLVYATEYGRSDHLMIEENRVRASSKNAFGFTNVEASWTMVEPGVYLVQVDLPKDLKNAELFWFEVWHIEQMVDQDGEPILDESGNQVTVMHSGSVIFDHNNQNPSCTGQ